MAKHIVEVVEGFEIRTPMGALTVGGTTIDAPRVHVSTYFTGEQCTFDNKKGAEAFCKAHGSKVKYIGPKPPKGR